MNTSYDALIIGSGIIGGSIAFELSKKGWKTLNIDKLAAAGYGSTANSCAVIRVHYSTLEGTAVAYESYHYWNESNCRSSASSAGGGSCLGISRRSRKNFLL